MLIFVLDNDRRMRVTDGPLPFEFKTDDNCGNEWKVWLRGFEIFAQANSMNDAREKLNWMLHYAGLKVQTVYYALPEKEVELNSKEIRKGPLASGYVKFQSDNEYDEAIKNLNNFFEPKQNVSYERHVFRQLKQNKTERIDMFMMRLREQADRCDFEDQLDENLRDQVISGCYSDLLRRKILERGSQNLDKIIEMARIREAVAKQQKSFTSKVVPGTKEENVCKIESERKFSTRQSVRSNSDFIGMCGRCGLRGHKAQDGNCPAKGKTCNRCGRKDHFARRCFLRNSGSNKNNFGKRKFEMSSDDASSNKMKKENVHMVDIESSHETKSIADEYDDIFCIDPDEFSNKIWCKIGGIDVEVVVDSGTRRNIVDRASWLEWKAKNIVTTHRQREVI